MSRQQAGHSPLWQRRPALLIATWAIACVVLALIGLSIGTRTTIPGPAARETLEANVGEGWAKSAGIPSSDSVLIILGSSDSSLSSAEGIRIRESLFDEMKQLSQPDSQGPLFKSIRTEGHTFAFGEKFISAAKQHVLYIAETNIPLQDSARQLSTFRQFSAQWNASHPDYQVLYLSQGTTDGEIFELINNDLDRSLIITIPLTFLVLIWAFQSAISALIPLGIAIFSLAASLGLAALVSHLSAPISASSAQLVVLLVLAIGVDYSLFLLSRVRQELRAGKEILAAINVAIQSTGSAVLWSGIIVALSLIGLLLMRDDILASMAFVAVLAVGFTAASCLLALPPIILLCRKFLGKDSALPESSAPIHQRALLGLSIKHPALSLIFSALILLPIAAAARHMQLGTTMEPATFPLSMQSARAFAELEKHFPDLAGVDFSLIVRAPQGESLSDSAILDSALERIQSQVNVRGPVRTAYSQDERVARFNFIASGSANSPANQRLLDQLYTEVIPSLRANNMEGELSGTLPFVATKRQLYASRTFEVYSAILLISFLFLLVVFRSIVIPIKAIILNLISVAFALGTLTLVFSGDHIALARSTVVESFVPALLYAVLFGLSMDYHVVLISRVREEALCGKSTREAVQIAITNTYRSITAAALIMCCVFFTIATLELPIMRQLGLGLAVAVFIDATIIRTVLLPASMVLLNSWNWYLPKCLRWIPELRVRD